MKHHFTWISPLCGFLLYLYCHYVLGDVLNHEAAMCAGITLWTALWWVTEAVPIPVASLLPLALFPLLNVIPNSAIASAYGHWLIILLMGGFIVSTAMETSGAHKRIALTMIRAFGQKSDRRLVLAFMIASASLSMWISNTATTLMLLPIVGAVCGQTENNKLRIALLLGIAYAANIGGIGTPIGTPPNLLLIAAYEEIAKEQNLALKTISFGQWMLWALPIIIIMVPLIAWYLTRNLTSKSDIQIPEVGPWRTAEIRVLIVFALMALCWMTRDMGGYGWRNFELLSGAKDSSVALLAIVALALIPSGEKDEAGHSKRLLEWDHAERIPWGLLLLFSSGLAIGIAFKSTGLSAILGAQLSGLDAFPLFLMILCICLFVTFLTEVTSNTATAAILMTILPAAASDGKLLYLLFPAVISASCAFMLPVATAPNAVVYSRREFSIATMAKTGFIINVAAACIVSLVTFCLL